MIKSQAAVGISSRSAHRLALYITIKDTLIKAQRSFSRLSKKIITLRNNVRMRNKGHALSCRASPLQKQSTGLFLNSPLAERLRVGEFRTLRSATRDAVPLTPATL